MIEIVVGHRVITHREMIMTKIIIISSFALSALLLGFAVLDVWP